MLGKSLRVGVHDGTPRWRVTAVSRDQANPGHYTGNQGGGGVYGDRLPPFTASWL